MAFHCINCNGSMVFDVASQQMRCEHCGSTADPQSFTFHDNAVVTSTITCQNCGAELEGTEDSLVGFCPYCGGQSLVTRPGGSFTAEKIIPFSVTRERCVETYADYTRHIPYLHKEFRDPEHIKKFTGIYMPYYQFDARFGQPHIEGTTTTHSGNYTEVRTYRIDTELEGDYQHGTPFDASKYLDDEIAARCMPFDTEAEKPFNPAYLAGFYADSSTAPAELYYEDAKAQAEQDLISAVGEELHGPTRIELSKSSRVETEITGHHAALFPLWFLTWRKDDRVAYAVVNGQSGKMVSDLPLDLKAFGIGCAVVSAVLFAIFELAFTPTPGATAFVSFLAAAIMAWSIHSSTKRLFEQYTHAHDKGWTAREGLNREPVRASGGGGLAAAAMSLLPFLIGVGIFAFVRLRGWTGEVIDADRLFDARGSILMKIAPTLVLVFALYVLFRVLSWHKELQALDAPIAIGSLVAAVLVNAAIIFIAPVDDLWYYIGDIVCIAGLVVSSVGMIRIYNLATTRPLPKLFDRKEA